MRYLGIIVLSLLFLLTGSCEKAGFGYVEGNVYERITGIPMEGASVNLYKSSSVVKQTTTNGAGYFKIKYYKRRPGIHYFLEVVTDNYSRTTEVDTRQQQIDFFMEK